MAILSSKLDKTKEKQQKKLSEKKARNKTILDRNNRKQMLSVKKHTKLKNI